jgi:hypothetical protein
VKFIFLILHLIQSIQNIIILTLISIKIEIFHILSFNTKSQSPVCILPVAYLSVWINHICTFFFFLALLAFELRVSTC